MGFKTRGMPYYGFNTPLFRSWIGAQNLPPCRDKLVQWLKSPAISGVLVDRVGSGGSEVGREDVVNRYFDGDGTRWVELDSDIDLGTSHTIEFIAEYSGSDVQMIIGNSVDSEYFILFNSTANQIRYQVDAGVSAIWNDEVDVSVRHKYKFIIDGLNVSLYIDEDYVSTKILLSNRGFVINQLFRRALGNIWEGNCDYIDLNGYDFDFTTGNQDTTVVGTNLSTGEFITGSIQAATGSDRLMSTNIGQSTMNDYGYVLSDGATFYYDQALTQFIPSGKYIQVAQNGVCSCFSTGGVQPLAKDVGGFVGGLKANVRVIDGLITGSISELWYQGNFSGSTGDLIPANNRITTLDMISCSGEVTVYSENGWEISIAEYDSSGAFIQGKYGYLGIQLVTLNVATRYIRIRIRMIDDSVIVPLDLFSINLYAYCGNYTLTDLPTSGQPVPGNSIIELTTRTVEADNLTTLQHFNHDDLDARYPIPVAVADQLNAMIDNPRFTKPDDLTTPTAIAEQLLYSEVITEPCFTAVLKYEKHVEPLLDIGGEQLTDLGTGEGETPTYALKEGVTTA